MSCQIYWQNTHSIHWFDASWQTKEEKNQHKRKIKGIVKRKGKKARKSNRKKRRRKIKTAFINVFGENIYKKIRGK